MAHEDLVKEGKKAISKNVKPEEIQDYFLHKGMDKKEAKEAVEKIEASSIIEKARKAEREAESQKTDVNAPKKSSVWLYFIILTILFGAGYYLYSSGLIDFTKFFKLNS